MLRFIVLLVSATICVSLEIDCGGSVSLGTSGHATVNISGTPTTSPCTYTATRPAGYGIELKCEPAVQFTVPANTDLTSFCVENYLMVNNNKLCPQIDGKTSPNFGIYRGIEDVALEVTSQNNVDANCRFVSYRDCTCGQRISGDSLYKSDVFLMEKGFFGNTVKQSGSIISDKWVLTSALTSSTNIFVATSAKVKISDIEKLEYFSGLPLTLVELKTSLTWSNTVGPACLPSDSFNITNDYQVTHWKYLYLIYNERITRNANPGECNHPGQLCFDSNLKDIDQGAGLISGFNNILTGVKIDTTGLSDRYESITNVVINWISVLANSEKICLRPIS